MEPISLVSSKDFKLRNTHLDKKPDPCPDCKQPYIVANSVEVRVSDGRLAWAGCIDCWVKRTSPEMCATFEEKNEVAPPSS